MATVPPNHTRSTEPPRPRGWIPLSLRLFAVVLVVFFGLFAWYAVPLKRYGDTSRRINARIISLEERCPATVDQQRWNSCVTWASIAACNVFASETHTRYDAMRAFEQDLDEKLMVPVDLTTIEWIGDRLATTSATGESYMTRFRPNWDDALREAAE